MVLMPTGRLLDESVEVIHENSMSLGLCAYVELINLTP